MPIPLSSIRITAMSASTVLTTSDLAKLNLEVDAQRQKPEDVAATYLKSKGLI